MSSVVTAGDVVLLWGEVGAGKSEFARGFLRTWMAQPQLTVRSPTYHPPRRVSARGSHVSHHRTHNAAAVAVPACRRVRHRELTDVFAGMTGEIRTTHSLTPNLNRHHRLLSPQRSAYHLDLYRLQEERELAVLPLQSMFEQGSVDAGARPAADHSAFSSAPPRPCVRPAPVSLLIGRCPFVACVCRCVSD